MTQLHFFMGSTTLLLLYVHLVKSTLYIFSHNLAKNVVVSLYRQVSNIRRTLAGNNIVDLSDVVEASPVGASPTTSSLST